MKNAFCLFNIKGNRKQETEIRASLSFYALHSIVFFFIKSDYHYYGRPKVCPYLCSGEFFISNVSVNIIHKK